MRERGSGTVHDDALPVGPSLLHGLRRHLPSLVGLVMFAVALYVLQRALADVTLAEVVAGFRSIAPTALAAAAALTVVNYLLQTLYDLIGLRYAGSVLPWRAIAAPAFCAMAVGHNVGLSALSGGAIRYRAYAARGLPGESIARIVVLYPIAYALGAATLLGATLALAPGSAPGGVWLGETTLRLAGLALCLVPGLWLLWAARARRPLTLGRWRVPAPPPRMALAQIALAVADILVAATVLYLLLPGSVGVGPIAFAGFYVVAVTIGTVSGVPGGLGVIEGSLVLLLPAVPVPTLLGALLAWRVIYFLVPLAVALVLLAWQLLRERSTPQ